MDSAAQIKEHAFRSIGASLFFRELCAGTLPRQALNQIFGQYYFWRSAVHKCVLGLCLEKSQLLDHQGGATATLLATTVGRKRYRHFLANIGAELQGLRIAPPTATYIEAFRIRSRDRGLSQFWAALAGCELLASLSNDLVLIALHSRYGVEDVGFWNAHIEDEEAHFWRMWTPLTELGADESVLVSAAMDEIERHVGLWDDLRNYSVAQAA